MSEPSSARDVQAEAPFNLRAELPSVPPDPHRPMPEPLAPPATRADLTLLWVIAAVVMAASTILPYVQFGVSDGRSFTAWENRSGRTKEVATRQGPIVISAAVLLLVSAVYMGRRGVRRLSVWLAAVATGASVGVGAYMALDLESEHSWQSARPGMGLWLLWGATILAIVTLLFTASAQTGGLSPLARPWTRLRWFTLLAMCLVSFALPWLGWYGDSTLKPVSIDGWGTYHVDGVPEYHHVRFGAILYLFAIVSLVSGLELRVSRSSSSRLVHVLFAVSCSALLFVALPTVLIGVAVDGFNAAIGYWLLILVSLLAIANLTMQAGAFLPSTLVARQEHHPLA